MTHDHTSPDRNHKRASLTPDVAAILYQQATEKPHTEKNLSPKTSGYFICHGCGQPLFLAKDQFESHCGWPSYDDAIPSHVGTQTDADGQRTEAHCARCRGHLGHVFHGEALTKKNTRYCINSLAIEWIHSEPPVSTQECIVAGGCFWGIEALMVTLPGVLKTEVGYCGGHTSNPSYHDVCQGNTGHVEAVRVVFDPKRCSLKQLLQYFLEIHDPYQKNGQGPDIGSQYQSCIFYEAAQHEIAKTTLEALPSSSNPIATQLKAMCPFWRAEKEHQQYHVKHPSSVTCHHYTRRFGDGSAEGGNA